MVIRSSTVSPLAILSAYGMTSTVKGYDCCTSRSSEHEVRENTRAKRTAQKQKNRAGVTRIAPILLRIVFIRV